MQRFLSKLFLTIVVFPTIIVNPSVSLAKAPTAKALLWEISGNGLNRPSYLLGTKHSGCAKRLALSPEQNQAMKKVEQVYLEIDKKELNLLSDIPETTREQTGLFEGKGLKERLTLSQYQLVEDYFGKGALDSFALKGVSVLNLYLLVKTELGMKIYDRLCKGSFTSKENVIVKAATNQKLPMLGIETLKERQNVIDAFSSEDNSVSQNEVNALLRSIHAVNMVDSDSASAETLFQEYIKFDERYFYQDISTVHKGLTGNSFTNALLVGRNKFWLPKMLKIMAQKPTLFAFGFAHLGGNEGLIPLLESKGYSVKPVFSNSENKELNSRRTSDSRAREYYEAGEEDSSSLNNIDALNNYDQAIEIWERNDSKDPDRAKAYHARSVLKRSYFCGFKSALADLNKSIALNPSYLLAYFDRGILKMEKLLDYQGALSDFNKAIVLNTDSSVVGYYYYRGILKSDHLNAPKDALADFNIYLARYPQDTSVLILRGILKHNKLSDRPGGIADLRRAALLSRNKGDKEELLRVLSVLKAINVSEAL